jgi:hypothetical protein
LAVVPKEDEVILAVESLELEVGLELEVPHGTPGMAVEARDLEHGADALLEMPREEGGEVVHALTGDEPLEEGVGDALREILGHVRPGGQVDGVTDGVPLPCSFLLLRCTAKGTGMRGKHRKQAEIGGKERECRACHWVSRLS